MSVLERAKADWLRHSQSAFDLDITLTTPDDSETATIKGIGAQNFIDFVSTDGQDAVGQHTHCSFHEHALIAANAAYPIRNAKNIVDLTGHKVDFVDSNNTVMTLVVINAMPDSTVGMIILDLGRKA